MKEKISQPVIMRGLCSGMMIGFGIQEWQAGELPLAIAYIVMGAIVSPWSKTPDWTLLVAAIVLIVASWIP